MYKIVEMKQAIIDQQEGVIKLMRELNLQQTANSTDRERIQYLLEKVFHQYDEAKQNMLSSEVIIFYDNPRTLLNRIYYLFT